MAFRKLTYFFLVMFLAILISFFSIYGVCRAAAGKTRGSGPENRHRRDHFDAKDRLKQSIEEETRHQQLWIKYKFLSKYFLPAFQSFHFP